MKRIVALFLAIVVMFSFAMLLSSCGTQGDPGVGITNVEIVDDQLIITYSDGTVKNLGNIVAEETGTQGLAYYPLPDGTYGVTAGTTQYLETIEIPATYKGKAVTQILNNAFKSATNLKNIVIPDSVTSIGSAAFYNCRSLTSITIPDGVTSISSSAFYNCRSLTSITIPDGVTSISSSAFWDCSSLTSITIPDGVTSIGDHAFTGCSSLTSINFNGTTAQWNAIEKGTFWGADNTGNYTVFCTDGNITK